MKKGVSLRVTETHSLNSTVYRLDTVEVKPTNFKDRPNAVDN